MQGRRQPRSASREIRAQLIERRCIGCHADFDIKRGMNDAQKDAAVLRFLLAQDGWIFPGNPAGRPPARPRLGQGRREGHAGGRPRN